VTSEAETPEAVTTSDNDVVVIISDNDVGNKTVEETVEENNNDTSENSNDVVVIISNDDSSDKTVEENDDVVSNDAVETPSNDTTTTTEPTDNTTTTSEPTNDTTTPSDPTNDTTTATSPTDDTTTASSPVITSNATVQTIDRDIPELTDLSLQDSNFVHLRNMVQCYQPYLSVDDVFDYTKYGCHCGTGTVGTALDATDQCCKDHDECYARAGEMSNKTQVTYKYQCPTTVIACGDEDGTFERFVCECDRKAASCFKNSRQSFDPATFNVTDRAECCSVSPPSDKCEQWSGEWDISVRLDTADNATTTTATTSKSTTEADSAATVSGGNLKLLAGISACLAMVYNM